MIDGDYKSKAKALRVEKPKTGAIIFSQRFGSALNLNLHFHILYLDGVYEKRDESMIFRRVLPPQKQEMAGLVRLPHKRLTAFFDQKGYLEEDHTLSDDASAPLSELNPLLAQRIAASVQNRIALGDRADQRLRIYDPAARGDSPNIPVRENARLLKRTFNIDVLSCPICSENCKIIAAIQDRKAITKKLNHLDLPSEPPQQSFDFDSL